MDIKLNFTVIECVNGHINEYFRVNCKTCGEPFNENFKRDPFVDLRSNYLQPLFKIINNKKAQIKKIHKDIDKGLIIRSEYYDDFTLLKEATSKISEFSDSILFKNINLDQSNLDSIENKKWLNEVCNIFSDIFDYLEKLLQIESKTIWRNALKRITKLISRTINAFSHMLSSAIAPTHEDAQKIQQEAQKKIDDCSMELTLLSEILYTINSSDNIDTFIDGKLNYSAIMTSLICGNNKENINETIKTMNNSTYYYFRNVLKYDINYYSEMELLLLSGFKQIGLSFFDDERYFRKIQIALNLINKTYNKNPQPFQIFFDLYQETYNSLLSKVNELNNQFAFVFGNKPNNLIIVQNLISWYKTLCEGIYRDASKILYFCTELIKKNDANITDILEWIGFRNIVERFKSQDNQNLFLLTDGVESVIRHSEAHVDYIIDGKNEKIIVRNKKVKEKQIEVKEYSFFEFLEVTMLLIETTFSIICAIDIFLLNNKHNFSSFLDRIYNYTYGLDANISESIFAFIGITIIKKEEFKTEDYRLLRFYGKCQFITYKGLVEKTMSVFYPLTLSKPEYDLMELNLTDNNDNMLCKIKLYTKYFKKYKDNERNDDLKKYLLFLTLKITEIHFEEKEEDTNLDKKDFDFISGILNLFAPRIKEMAENKPALLDLYESNIDIYKKVLDETNYVTYVIKEYLDFCNDKRVIKHFYEIMNSIEDALNIIITNQRVSEITFSMFKKISNEVNRAVKLSELFLEGKDKEKFLLKNTTEGIELFKKAGRNSPCPCGSRLKFKKCCGKD